MSSEARLSKLLLLGMVLAGHYEVAELLLDHGANAREFTFDGDRCHYAALTTKIRCAGNFLSCSARTKNVTMIACVSILLHLSHAV